MSAVAAAVLMLAAAPVPAQDWYAVEVIVFQHRADATSAGERWPRDPGTPALENAAELAAPTDPPSLRPFEQLDPRALTMGGALRTLDRSSRYEPLVHFGWMQPGLSRDTAVALRIGLDSGRRLAVEPLVIESPDAEPAPAETIIDPFADGMDVVEREPEPEPEPEIVNPWLVAHQLRETHAEPPTPERLSGTLTLILQRFLHLEADLLLTTDEPLPRMEGERGWHERREEILADLTLERIGPDEARARLEALDAEPRFQAYRLQERRRVRTGEIHYFDHPKFGIVATVRPVPREEVERRREAMTAAPPSGR